MVAPARAEIIDFQYLVAISNGESPMPDLVNPLIFKVVVLPSVRGQFQRFVKLRFSKLVSSLFVIACFLRCARARCSKTIYS